MFLFGAEFYNADNNDASDAFKCWLPGEISRLIHRGQSELAFRKVSLNFFWLHHVAFKNRHFRPRVLSRARLVWPRVLWCHFMIQEPMKIDAALWPVLIVNSYV